MNPRSGPSWPFRRAGSNPAMSTHPTFGVEEEFLLVDPESGAPVPLNRAVAAQAEARGVDLQLELTSCQVETTSSVASSSVDLRTELARLRRVSAEAAASSGALLLAVALPPTVPHEFPVTDEPRYRAIAERFGMIAREQGICGCHVHVAVPNRELAVKVGNRLRPWLPMLLALSANSAVYRSADTGHASWRSVLWARWPSACSPRAMAPCASGRPGLAATTSPTWWKRRRPRRFRACDLAQRRRIRGGREPDHRAGHGFARLRLITRR